ncbi:hypothetical protein SUZIE_172045 [Sciurus carolinensis]|uniref:Uncharacterized protein n=1 Tax=Sciurus carolinensis TaxID=30640 RepID=A0AA41T4N5_SCICA|nr:hypothetical protein [Sciurus carolinensis]
MVKDGPMMESGTQLCPRLKKCVGQERGRLRKTAHFPDPPSTSPGTIMGRSPAWPPVHLGHSARDRSVPGCTEWSPGGRRQRALEEPPAPALALEKQVRAHQEQQHGDFRRATVVGARGTRPLLRRSHGRWFPASTSVGPGNRCGNVKVRPWAWGEKAAQLGTLRQGLAATLQRDGAEAQQRHLSLHRPPTPSFCLAAEALGRQRPLSIHALPAMVAAAAPGLLKVAQGRPNHRQQPG